jgi:hypothetical protein
MSLQALRRRCDSLISVTSLTCRTWFVRAGTFAKAKVSACAPIYVAHLNPPIAGLEG